MFWLAVLVGILVAVVAIKNGFYSMWAILFNILISIYLGVMLCPTIIGLIPDIGDSRYHHAGCIAGVAVVVFAIFQTITVNFLMGTETGKGTDKISFPKVFNTVGAGVIGFLTGYIVCGFVVFVFVVTPLSQEPMVKGIFEQSGFAAQSVENLCGFVGAVSLQCYDEAGPGDVVEWLATPEKKSESKPARPRRVETDKAKTKKPETKEVEAERKEQE